MKFIGESNVGGFLGVALGIIGLATVAVLVSRKGNTPSVIQAAASGFGNVLGVAQSPVTGARNAVYMGYPGGIGQSFDGASAPYLGG